MTGASATSLDVSAPHSWPLSPPDQLLLLEDSSATLSPEQVAAMAPATSSGFLPASNNLTPGFSDSVWWLRLDLTNSSATPRSLLLSLASSRLGHVDFYVKQAGRWTHGVAGANMALSHWTWPARHPILPLQVPPGELSQVLVRVTGEVPLVFQIGLYTNAAFEAAEQRTALWDGALMGALLAMAWCAFLICLMSRSLPFLLLALVCANVALYEFAIRGYGMFYLWPEAANWNYRSPFVLASAWGVLITTFVLALVHKEKVTLPQRRFFIGLGVLQGVGIVLGLFADITFASAATLYINTAFSIALVPYGLLLLRRRTPGTKLMVLATSFALFNFALVVADLLGLARDTIQDLSLDVDPTPIIALVGVVTYLTVLAAWIHHVGAQRGAAHSTLLHWQEQEHARLRDEILRQTSALHDALRYAREKNQQMTQTLGYIGHDLRAPLATISGYMRLLRPGSDHHQVPHLQAIERSVVYQMALIDELLEYAKGELTPLEIAPVSTDLNALLRDIAQESLALSEPQGNRFIYDAPQPLPDRMMIDGRRLQQVLLNLLSNAAKFTHHGEIRLLAVATQDINTCLLEFTVTDTGPGIALEAQAGIFAAFHQLQRNQGGVGLGLFIAHRIVEHMGGTLQLTSVPGQGTCLRFQIRASATWLHVNLPLADTAVTLHAPSDGAAPLSGPDLAHLALLARGGALTELEHWLEKMEGQYPQSAQFLADVRAALQSLDFARLESLALAEVP